jgi:prophage maintenance system killer protein
MEGELDEAATTEECSVVQDEGSRKVRRTVRFYSLDVIISVGYRVKSARGTKFRIWATNVLRQHLLRGYTVNERRLRELRQSVRLIEHVLDAGDAVSDEAATLVRLVTDYAAALDLLDDYDHQRVTMGAVHPGPAVGLSYAEALRIIAELRERFGASDLFGREKDESLHSSLNAVMQTFDGRDLYPGVEEKAARLLYFLVKNHSFVDGNKRIAAALFLWFLDKNGLLHRADAAPTIEPNTLAAITLLTAVSRPEERDVIVNIVVNLIHGQD